MTITVSDDKQHPSDKVTITIDVPRKSTMFPTLVSDFGGNGNNVFDNATAFADAQSSSYQRIYLPEGTYYTSGLASSLSKHYYGPGKIRTLGGDNTPGRFFWNTIRPATGTGSSYTKFFTADLRTVDASYGINAGSRQSLTEPYFAPETSMTLGIYDNRSGQSGTDARLTVIAALGATSATLNSAQGFSVGAVIGFNDGNDGITNTRTVTSIVGNVISWVGDLAAPAPYAVGSRVTHGTRTMNSMNHWELQHRGGGDGYINLMRVEVSYTGVAGQDHVFFRSTGGCDGGDIVASTAGVYMTGRELTFDDNSFDVAVLGDIRTFSRKNSTGALETFWHGSTFNSDGTQACDAAYIAAGKWKTVIDSSRADTSTFGGCVFNMAVDQYLYWGSTGDSSKIYESWGRLRGPHRFGYSSGAGEMQLQVNSSLVFAASSTRARFPLETKFEGAVEFHNTNPIPKPTLPAAATDLTTAITLVNSIRTALINYGLTA